MQVIQFINERPREARNFRDEEIKVLPGDKLYAIQADGYYFAWCYANREVAEEVVNNGLYFDNNRSNWKKTTNETTLAGKRVRSSLPPHSKRKPERINRKRKNE